MSEPELDSYVVRDYIDVFEEIDDKYRHPEAPMEPVIDETRKIVHIIRDKPKHKDVLIHERLLQIIFVLPLDHFDAVHPMIEYLSDYLNIKQAHFEDKEDQIEFQLSQKLYQITKYFLMLRTTLTSNLHSKTTSIIDSMMMHRFIEHVRASTLLTALPQDKAMSNKRIQELITKFEIKL